MRRVTGAAIELAILVERKQGLAITSGKLHAGWWFHPDGVGVFSFLPEKTRVQYKTIVTGEAHTFRADDILFAGIDRGLWVEGNQGCYIFSFELGKPHDMAGGALPVG